MEEAMLRRFKVCRELAIETAALLANERASARTLKMVRNFTEYAERRHRRN